MDEEKPVDTKETATEIRRYEIDQVYIEPFNLDIETSTTLHEAPDIAECQVALQESLDTIRSRGGLVISVISGDTLRQIPRPRPVFNDNILISKVVGFMTTKPGYYEGDPINTTSTIFMINGEENPASLRVVRPPEEVVNVPYRPQNEVEEAALAAHFSRGMATRNVPSRNNIKPEEWIEQMTQFLRNCDGTVVGVVRVRAKGVDGKIGIRDLFVVKPNLPDQADLTDS